MRYKIAILDDYQRAALDLSDWTPVAAAELTVFSDTLTDVDSLVARLAPFDVLVLMRERTRFTAELLRQLPNLKLLTTTGAHNAAIDLAAAQRQGVVVCGTPPAGGVSSTAMLTWTLLLALLRGLTAESGSLRAGGWQRGLGVDIDGKVLGLIGLGRVGARVARVATAFGMDVLAWSPNLTPERAAAAGAIWVSKDGLLERSDVISLHLVLSDRTRSLIDSAAIAHIKPDAFLINTARAELVDETALIDALTRGTIGGAGLDVFSQEPLPPDHPYRWLPNVLATPHIGFVTRQNQAAGYDSMIENIVAFVAGAPIRMLGQPWT